MRPNYNILIVSILLTVLVYFTWYELNKSTFDSFEDTKIDTSEPKRFYNTYEIFYKLVREGRNNIVLVAKDNIDLNIFSPTGDIHKTLAVGEAYFLTIEENQSIWLDKTYSVDVYVNDDENTFVGVFEDLVS